jgi:hypothetical protein
MHRVMAPRPPTGVAALGDTTGRVDPCPADPVADMPCWHTESTPAVRYNPDHTAGIRQRLNGMAVLAAGLGFAAAAGGVIGPCGSWTQPSAACR